MKFTNFCTKFMVVCGIIFFSILTLCTLLFTTVLRDYSASGYNIIFAPLTILGILILIAVISIPSIKNLLLKIDPRKFARFVFIWGLIISILWVFIANVLPMWDSMDLISAANLINGTPDQFSGSYWSKGWYMERYPYQVPMVLLITLCMRIAGTNAVILFEIINCFACALTMYLIMKLTHEFFHKKNVTVLSGFLAMFFIPIILYCTFIYGNIICLPLALAGILFQKKSMDSTNKRRSVIFALVSVLLISLSVIVKSSMSVILIASAIIWILWAIKQKKIQPIIFVLLPFILVKSFTLIGNTIISNKVDTNLNNGVPKIAWITMGLGGGAEYLADQENNPELSSDLSKPGWYDGFAWVTSADEYSPQKVSEISSEYLKKRIGHFSSDPIFTFKFFAKKILIEWAEPTFDGFLTSNWDKTFPSTGYNMAEREYTTLGRSFYYGKMHGILSFIMDVTQTLLAAGALFALIVYRKKLSISQFMPLLFILGGAVLYLFWETKSQYMFPFYLMMIPYSALGITYLTTKCIPKLYCKFKK